MDHYASTLLEGDAHVMRYLGKETHINQIPLALQRTREEEIANSGMFRKFCVGQTYYNVKTSDYGKRSKQTSTNPLRNAEFLGDSGKILIAFFMIGLLTRFIVDREAKAKLTEEYRMIEGNLQQADVVIKEYNLEHDQVKQKIQELKHRKEDLIAQKRDVQIAAQSYNMKLSKLADTKAQLEDLKQKPATHLAKIKQFEREAEKYKAEEDRYVQDYVKSLKKYVDCYEMRNVYKLQEIHANEKFRAIRTYSTEQDKALSEAESELAKAKKSYQGAQRQAQVYKKECEDAGANLSEELYAQFQDILRKWKEEGTDETLETLEEKIAEEKGRAEGIRFANPDAMKHYEERKIEIDRLQKKINGIHGGIENCREEIAKLRVCIVTQWNSIF